MRTDKEFLALLTDSDFIFADYSQIQQLLMNLVSNAVQAMTPSGGTLKLNMSNVSRGPECAVTFWQYLMIPVKDTHKGISAGDLKDIRTIFYNQSAWHRYWTYRCLENNSRS